MALKRHPRKVGHITVERVNFSLKTETVDKLKLLAKEQGKSMSRLIGELIEKEAQNV